MINTSLFNISKLKFLLLASALVLSLSLVVGMVSASELSAGTRVPGHEKERYDQDNNGYPDAGVYVNGHYNSVYAYDASGAYYWDLGDGRIYTSPGISTKDDLDQSTLSTCDYEITYRADFGNDPYMNEGWITNNIHCYGYDGNSSYNYLIVSQTDPRYTGNPDYAIWGTWEYKVLTESGVGNFVRPEKHVL